MMKQEKQNGSLKLTCPYCRHEHAITGVPADSLRDCLCPDCGGFCLIYEMDYGELLIWLHDNQAEGGGHSA
jgi:hypothetical protein